MNPVQYTSRTFATIMADINSDPLLADKPEFFKRLIAGVGDVISMWVNAAANEAYLPTAFTRRAVKDLCALIDYQLAQAIPAFGTLIFECLGTLTTASFTAAELAAKTRGTIGASSLRFESRAAGALAVDTATVNLTTSPPSGNAVLVARSFITGEKCRVSGAGLPTGLVAATDYWVIRVDATHVKFAASQAAAYAGTNLTVSGGSGVMTITLKSFLATVYNQELKSAIIVGQGDLITPWLEFDLRDTGVLKDTLTVTINSDSWTRVDSLAFSIASDRHFVLNYRSNGSAFIMFGDGVYGAIPAAFDVIVQYAIGGGVAGNVSAASINIYAGTNSTNITGCSNPVAMGGGSDEESIETARRVAPGLLKARDRFITQADGEALVLAYGGISLVSITSNFYGVLTCRVIGIAIGGGDVGSTLRAAVQQYLIDRSVLGSIDVRFVACTLTTTAVTSAAKMRSGYLWATALPYFRLAWKLFLSEAGAEILTAYLTSLSAAVLRINAIFTETFTTTDAKIIQILDSFAVVGARTFGETIQESDAFSFIQGAVPDIDYMTISAPSFPIILASDAITTIGALTLTEIT